MKLFDVKVRLLDQDKIQAVDDGPEEEQADGQADFGQVDPAFEKKDIL